MMADNYLAEVPAVFNELARKFMYIASPPILGQGGQHRRDGVLESHAGKIAADVLAGLALAVDSEQLTPGQLWSAIAAERGNVGACNMIANVARAAHGQMIANETSPDKALTKRPTDAGPQETT